MARDHHCLTRRRASLWKHSLQPSTWSSRTTVDVKPVWTKLIRVLPPMSANLNGRQRRRADATIAALLLQRKDQLLRRSDFVKDAVFEIAFAALRFVYDPPRACAASIHFAQRHRESIRCEPCRDFLWVNPIAKHEFARRVEISNDGDRAGCICTRVIRHGWRSSFAVAERGGGRAGRSVGPRVADTPEARRRYPPTAPRGSGLGGVAHRGRA